MARHAPTIQIVASQPPGGSITARHFEIPIYRDEKSLKHFVNLKYLADLFTDSSPGSRRASE